MPAKRKLPAALSTEDWLAIWIGFIILGVGLALYFTNPPEGMREEISGANAILEKESGRAPFKTVRWYQANDAIENLKAKNTETGKFISNLFARPREWDGSPIAAFYATEAQARENTEAPLRTYKSLKEKEENALSMALALEAKAEKAGFSSGDKNAAATNAITEWRLARRESAAAKKQIPKGAYNLIPGLIASGIIFAIIFGAGIFLMGKSFLRFAGGFIFIFIIAAISYFVANNETMDGLGLGYALWAILFGLIISNTVGTPKWVMPAVQTEYYIKTGLVLLGAEVLFSKILLIGLPGILVAWIVTPVVIISSYAFGRRVIKIKSNELNITMSSAVSVCGVSAAIATAAACKAKKEELTLAVGLSLIFTAIMMALMPAFIKWAGMSEVLGGAWMGGVIDSTGAVAAAGAFLGEKALQVAATIKMIQNILIGIVAFFVAFYWTVKFGNERGNKPNAMEIWRRFPKFVLGFAAASVIMSVIASGIGPDLTYALIDNGVTGGFTKTLRGWMFCLAFVSIGLSTNFRELSSQFSGGKPFTLYVFGQTFNLLLTLLIAWLAFYVIFPYITESI